ncbi:MAG: hypothetical protein VX498_06650 [Myxococcota bacterium]|nr:hypothetical protein [Myxococcota bacterium]
MTLRAGGLSLLLLALLLLVAPQQVLGAAPEGAGWSRVEASPFTFHYRSVDKRTAVFLAQESPRLLADVVAQTGLPVGGPIDVVLAPDAQTFAEVQPAPPPVWAVGTAWSRQGAIYLHTRRPGSGLGSIDQVFVHETVHILLGRAWEPGHPPRWLNEGLARYVSRELTPRDHVVLARAAVAGRLLPLEDFADQWPSSAGRAHLAYIQSVNFVAFLDRSGRDVLPQLLARLSRGEGLEPALKAVTGESLSDLEGRWRGRMTFWHGVFPVLGSSTFLWGLTSILFLAAAFKRRRAVKRQIASMVDPYEEEERWEAERRWNSVAAPPEARGTGDAPGGS